MRRNFASLDLTALRESASAGEDDAANDVDLAAMDADAAALYADVLGLDDDEQRAASAVAHLCLDDDAGCPLEMMADKNASQLPPSQRPTSPPSAVPVKALPAIRPSANDPVRRSHVDFDGSCASPLASSPFTAKTTHKQLPSAPILLHGDRVAAPLVPIHRNAIQSV